MSAQIAESANSSPRIPEDILAKAETVYNVLETTNPHYEGSQAERLDIKAIARALMEAEARGEARGMEEAAQIADSLRQREESTNDSDPWSYGYLEACEEIATAIRTGGKNE